jgi:transposase
MRKTTYQRIPKTALQQLRGASARERFLHRLHCAALALAGLSASEVGRIYGDSPRAVAYWVKRFKAEGVSGLEEEARPGRPSKLNPAQLKKVQTFVKRAGRKSEPVNAAALSAYLLTEFEIGLTPRQCWRILGRLRS